MPHLTRREVIAGLAATTATFSIGCCREAERIKSQQIHPAAAKLAPPVKCAQLNVVLHGLMAIGVLTNPPSPNEGIRLVFPDIPDGGTGSPAHQYLMGNVTAATSGNSDLIGFAPGAHPHQVLGLLQGSHPDFSQEPSTFFLPNSGNSLHLDEPGKRVVIMPWPKSIMSVNKMYIGPVSTQCESPVPLISTPSAQDPNGKLINISTIHILTYDCDPNDTNGPRVIKPDGTDLGWIPQPRMLPAHGCTTAQTANLHIFAEPQERVKNVNHVVHAFHELMATIKKNGGGDLSTDYGFVGFNSFTIGDAQFCPPDGKCRPGIIPDLDLANLVDLSASEAGEVANCIQGVVNLG
jgi:hypothetical protein